VLRKCIKVARRIARVCSLNERTVSERRGSYKTASLGTSAFFPRSLALEEALVLFKKSVVISFYDIVIGDNWIGDRG